MPAAELLAVWVSPRALCSPAWTRTRNPLINSQMLCRLSYRGRSLSRLERLADLRGVR